MSLEEIRGARERVLSCGLMESSGAGSPQATGICSGQMEHLQSPGKASSNSCARHGCGQGSVQHKERWPVNATSREDFRRVRLTKRLSPGRKR